MRKPTLHRLPAPLFALSLAACSSNAGSGGGSSTSIASGGAGGTSGDPDTFVVGGDRPATVVLPPGHDRKTPAPLLVMLHSFTTNPAGDQAYLGLLPEARKRGLVYAQPLGTTDSKGRGFWNASDACCDFSNTNVDDSAYLVGLVDAIAAKVAVDSKRVFFAGHSNGAFMSYRVACDHADRVAAIAPLAGEMPLDTSHCHPSEPVSVLHIQGTADPLVVFEGGSLWGNPPFPGAQRSVDDWIAFDGCDPKADPSGAPLDIVRNLDGAETRVTSWHGCAKQSAVELWAIQGGGHSPQLQPSFPAKVIGWLLAHPKP